MKSFFIRLMIIKLSLIVLACSSQDNASETKASYTPYGNSGNSGNNRPGSATGGSSGTSGGSNQGAQGGQQQNDSVLEEIAQRACTLAAGELARKVDTGVDFQNACSFNFELSRCAGVIESGCRIWAGEIEIRNALPSISNPTFNRVADEFNEGLLQFCKTPGRNGFDPRTALCATISEAMGQIKMSLTSSNGMNHWANCFGTGQAGACIGQRLANFMLGTREEDFEAPVRPATVVETSSGTARERDYCYCQHSCYVDDYLSDTRLRKGDYKWITNTSTGAAGQRFCDAEEGTKHWLSRKHNGFHVYWQLSNCSIRRLRLPQNGGSPQILNGSQWQNVDARFEGGSCF